MQQEDLARCILESTESVFSTMLGLEVKAGEPRVNCGNMGPSFGVAALVGLAGPWGLATAASTAPPRQNEWTVVPFECQGEESRCRSC